MKILYISPNGYLGGAERFICNAAQGHINSDIVQFEILFFSDGDAAELCRKIGTKVHILPIKFKMRNIFKVLLVCLYIRKYIKAQKFDIIHSTMPYAHIIAFLSTILLKIKRVWFQHGPVGGILDKIANITKVDRIYFNSRYLEKEHLLMPFSNRNIRKHIMINYGILEANINENNVGKIKNENLNGARYLFLSAGRLCPWKGQLELIKAIQIIQKENIHFLSKVQFLIIGSYGRAEDKVYEDKIKEEINNAKLQDHILMLGHKNNIQDYYSACDIFLHTSIIPEPFGLVVAESMKNRCLVIGSNKGGVQDILEDMKTGFTYPSTQEHSERDLSKVLLKVYKHLENDSNLIEQIKNNAANLINNEYTVEKMTNKLENDYRKFFQKTIN